MSIDDLDFGLVPTALGHTYVFSVVVPQLEQPPATTLTPALGVPVPSAPGLGEVIAEALTGSIGRLTASGALDAMLDKHVEAAVDEAMRSLAGQYSDLGRLVKKAISDGLGIDAERLGLGAYQAKIVELVGDHVKGCIEGEWSEYMAQQLDEVLSNAPAEIKLTELLDELAQDEFRYSSDIEPGHPCGQTEVHVGEHSDPDDFFHVSWDFEGKHRHSMKYKMMLGRGKIHHFHVRGEIRRRIGSLSALERRLFQLETGRTRVIVDMEPGTHTHETEIEL